MSGKLDELIGSSRLGRAWRAFRDRLLVSPEFQRFALKFPLTRPIARRYTRELFDICAGFVYTQVLLACVRLDVFGRLSQGPRTLSELSAEMALPESSCRTLLEAAVALSLVDHRGKDVYGLGMLGTAVLANPGVAAMVDHHDLLYADLEDPVAILRQRPDETRLSQYWAYAREPSPAGLPSSGIDRYTSP